VAWRPLHQVTYHGPGQLVVYPIVSLRELGVGARAYVEGLEDALIRTAGVHGISARVQIFWVSAFIGWLLAIRRRWCHMP
jgi:hypothetical protein